MYRITELFLTLQGEGYHSGTKAVFVRFSGCNLWNGLESGRNAGKADCSKWCDTFFLGKTKLTASQLAEQMEALWPRNGSESRRVVFTGGEPLLQLDQMLVDTLMAIGWDIAVETNGTVTPKFNPNHVWICISPKRGSSLVMNKCDELKLVLPGGWSESEIQSMSANINAKHKYVQPVDSTDEKLAQVGRMMCVDLVLKSEPSSGWRASVQTHKHLGIA